MGACLQVLISVAFKNSNYALLPAATILSLRVVDALMIHFDLKRNPYLVGSIIKKRTTAVVPDMDGNLVAPGSQKVAIILLGAKSNHPFGVLAPEFLKTFKWLAEMNASFDGARPHGCKTSLTSFLAFLPVLTLISQSSVKRTGSAKTSEAPWSSSSYPTGAT